jgi:tetratricopeptide (TPR) repeat protein
MQALKKQAVLVALVLSMWSHATFALDPRALLEAEGHYRQGKLIQAEERFARALANASKPLTAETPNGLRREQEFARVRRRCLMALADICRRLGRSDDALRYAIEYRRELEELPDESVKVQLQENAISIAEDQMALNNYAKARTALAELLEGRYGPLKLVPKFSCLVKSATIEEVAGNAEAAESHWSTARQLGVDLSTKHKRHLAVTDQIFCARNLVLCYEATGDDPRAQQFLKSLVEIHERQQNGLSQKRETFIQLATHSLLRKDWARAESYFRRALDEAIEEADSGPRAYLLRMLALALKENGQHQQAAEAWEKSAALYEQLVKETEADGSATAPKTAYLKPLRQIYRRTGRVKDALRVARELHIIYDRELGKSHAQTVDAKNALASLQGASGQYKTARPLLQEVVRYWRERRTSAPLKLAGALNNLAAVERAVGDYAVAGALFVEALEIRSNFLPPDHPDLYTSYNNLASVFVAKGQYARAIHQYENVVTRCKRRASLARVILVGCRDRLVSGFPRGGVVRTSASLASSSARCRARSLRSPSALACIRQAIFRIRLALWRDWGASPNTSAYRARSSPVVIPRRDATSSSMFNRMTFLSLVLGVVNPGHETH